MKRNFILLLFCFIATYANAQTITSGYYITSSNDTLNTQLKVPETLFNQVSINRLYTKIKVVDSSGNFIKLKPGSIKGFGFTWKDKEYAFISKPVKHQGNKFFEVISSGNKANLLYYSFYNYSGKARYKKEIFIIEKSVDTDLLLKNNLTRRRIRKNLKEFYSDNPALLNIIDSSDISFWHLKSSLKTLVDDINKP